MCMEEGVKSRIHILYTHNKKYITLYILFIYKNLQTPSKLQNALFAVKLKNNATGFLMPCGWKIMFKNFKSVLGKHNKNSGHKKLDWSWFPLRIIHQGNAFLRIEFFTIKIFKNLNKNRRPFYENLLKQGIEISQFPPAQGFLRKVQLGNLTLLLELDKFCKQNNLKYWLDFGTLLGALRHKGFIPWDDDIDVGMPREDFEKIKTIFDAKNTNPDLYIEHRAENRMPIKIMHRNLPLFIDIFPYDMHNEKLNNEQKTALNQKLRKIVSQLKNSRKKLRKLDSDKAYETYRTIYKNEIIQGSTVDEKIKPTLFWGVDFPHRWRNWAYDWDMIFPFSKIEFEGHVFDAPANAKEVAGLIYGDYMSMPKEIFPAHVLADNPGDEHEKRLEEYLTRCEV